MKIEFFSNTYRVRALGDKDLEDIYELCSKNITYYKYCPPFVTRQAIADDMKALPPGKSFGDKYYVGFYEKEKLIAVMDMISDYPKKGIAYIGFFMTDIRAQNKGIGTEIIEYLCNYLLNLNYKSIQLAWVKGNPQAEHFWLKNRFMPIKETSSNAAAKVILSERMLNID